VVFLTDTAKDFDFDSSSFDFRVLGISLTKREIKECEANSVFLSAGLRGFLYLKVT
jgi:hypothetical protein